jgi:hypothetical protein
MSITKEQRRSVRERANFACEFCGVSESDTAGQLTIDHFQPKSKGGDDNLDNLLYSCMRCNLYKQDYWPENENAPKLWNPRNEPPERHFLEIEDGKLISLTNVGEFTIKRLRLNRPPLIAYRRFKWEHSESKRLLVQYRNLISLLAQLNSQLELLTLQQKQQLAIQQELLNLLLGIDED